jgi:hypothetical protein
MCGGALSSKLTSEFWYVDKYLWWRNGVLYLRFATCLKMSLPVGEGMEILQHTVVLSVCCRSQILQTETPQISIPSSLHLRPDVYTRRKSAALQLSACLLLLFDVITSLVSIEYGGMAVKGDVIERGRDGSDADVTTSYIDGARSRDPLLQKLTLMK